MDASSTPETPNIFWLVSYTLILGDPAVPGQVLSRQANLLLETPTPQINKAVLGHVQHLAVQGAVDRLGIVAEHILDLVINNIMPLGQMTSSEFQAEAETKEPEAPEVPETTPGT